MTILSGVKMEATFKKYAVLPLRVIQIVCIAGVITGFIWASSDFLLVTVLVQAPVTPISVLLMLYGTMGSLLSEIIIRLLGKKKQTTE